VSLQVNSGTPRRTEVSLCSVSNDLLSQGSGGSAARPGCLPTRGLSGGGSVNRRASIRTASFRFSSSSSLWRLTCLWSASTSQGESFLSFSCNAAAHSVCVCACVCVRDVPHTQFTVFVCKCESLQFDFGSSGKTLIVPRARGGGGARRGGVGSSSLITAARRGSCKIMSD